MLYLIGPDGLVNLSFENFQKMVWMTMIHIILIHTIFWKFAYPQLTRYADFAGFPTKSFLNGMEDLTKARNNMGFNVFGIYFTWEPLPIVLYAYNLAISYTYILWTWY